MANFPYYPKLPSEVRDMIWHITLAQAHQERHIFIRLDEEVDVWKKPVRCDFKYSNECADYCPIHRIPYSHDWKRDCLFNCVPHERYWNKDSHILSTMKRGFRSLRNWHFTGPPKSKSTQARDIRLSCRQANNHAIHLRENQLRLFPGIESYGATQAEAAFYNFAENVSFEFDTFHISGLENVGVDISGSVWLPSFMHHLRHVSIDVDPMFWYYTLIQETIELRSGKSILKTKEMRTNWMLRDCPFGPFGPYWNSGIRAKYTSGEGIPSSLPRLIRDLADDPFQDLSEWPIVTPEDVYPCTVHDMPDEFPPITEEHRRRVWTQEEKEEWIGIVLSTIANFRTVPPSSPSVIRYGIICYGQQ